MRPAISIGVVFVLALGALALAALVSCGERESERAGIVKGGRAQSQYNDPYAGEKYAGASHEDLDSGGEAEPATALSERKEAVRAPRAARYQSVDKPAGIKTRRERRATEWQPAESEPAPAAMPAKTPSRPVDVTQERPFREERSTATITKPDEFFKSYGVNPFVDTSEDNLSTFAIDVDRASYTIARKYLGRGYLPPKQAVRTEEFVNYFKYFYKPPKDEAFAIYLEGAPSWFGSPGHQLLKIGIKGREVRKSERKKAILTFVIDVSGSMSEGGRLEHAKEALYALLDQMRDGDRVGIITYNTTARIVTEPLPAKEKDALVSAIRDLYPGGTTNAQAGLRKGYEMAMKHYDAKLINRIVFCSDGVTNVGATNAEDILEDVKSHDACGIYLTTVGFGVDNYNDTLLEQLADKGDGNYAYVDSFEEARKVFVDELTGTLQVIAKDVKVQVEFDRETVRRYRLLGYENRAVADSRFRDDREDGGEIGAGHAVTALYEVELRGRVEGRLGTVFVRYKDPDSFKVREVRTDIRASHFTPSFHEATENFRLAATVAEFAEILRESYWAEGSHLGRVYRLARILAPEFDNRKDVVEFVGLVTTAAEIRGDSLKGGYADEPSDTGGFQTWLSGSGRRAEEPPLSYVLPLVLVILGITLGRVAYLHGFRRYRSWNYLPVFRRGGRRRRGRR